MRQVGLEPSRTPRRRPGRMRRVRQPRCRCPRTPAPGRRPARKRLLELYCTFNIHPFIRGSDVTRFVRSIPGRRGEPPGPKRSPACRFNTTPPPRPQTLQGQEGIGAAPCAPLGHRACKARSTLLSRWPKGHPSGLIVWLDGIRRQPPSASEDGNRPRYRSGSDRSEGKR